MGDSRQEGSLVSSRGHDLSPRPVWKLWFWLNQFPAGLYPSTLKVYVVAIAASHAPLGVDSLGRNPLVSRILSCYMRMRPESHARVLAWHLALVLEGLSTAPFEPILAPILLQRNF